MTACLVPLLVTRMIRDQAGLARLRDSSASSPPPGGAAAASRAGGEQ